MFRSTQEGGREGKLRRQAACHPRASLLPNTLRLLPCRCKSLAYKNRPTSGSRRHVDFCLQSFKSAGASVEAYGNLEWQRRRYVCKPACKCEKHGGETTGLVSLSKGKSGGFMLGPRPSLSVNGYQCVCLS